MTNEAEDKVAHPDVGSFLETLASLPPEDLAEFASKMADCAGLLSKVKSKGMVFPPESEPEFNFGEPEQAHDEPEVNEADGGPDHLLRPKVADPVVASLLHDLSTLEDFPAEKIRERIQAMTDEQRIQLREAGTKKQLNRIPMAAYLRHMWKVKHESIVELMLKFHKQYARGIKEEELTPVESFGVYNNLGSKHLNNAALAGRRLSNISKTVLGSKPDRKKEGKKRGEGFISAAFPGFLYMMTFENHPAETKHFFQELGERLAEPWEQITWSKNSAINALLAWLRLNPNYKGSKESYLSFKNRVRIIEYFIRAWNAFIREESISRGYFLDLDQTWDSEKLDEFTRIE